MPDEAGATVTVSIRVMSAGDGYMHHMKSVVAGDGDRSLSTPLTRKNGLGPSLPRAGRTSRGRPGFCSSTAALDRNGLDSVAGEPPRRAYQQSQVKVIEGVFTTVQKQEIIKNLTNTMMHIEGENLRSITWCVLEEVSSGDWGIAGQPLSTEDVMALVRSAVAD